MYKSNPMPFSFSQCSICSYGILQIVMTHVNNVFSAYFVLAQTGLSHLPLPLALPLPTGFHFNMCRHYDFVSMMDYAFVACDSWTSPPSSVPLWVCVSSWAAYWIRSTAWLPDISLNYISIIAIELCNLWCVLLHTHTHAHTGAQVCQGMETGL